MTFQGKNFLIFSFAFLAFLFVRICSLVNSNDPFPGKTTVKKELEMKHLKHVFNKKNISQILYKEIEGDYQVKIYFDSQKIKG